MMRSPPKGEKMANHDKFWLLEAASAETVLRGIELGMAERPDSAAAPQAVAADRGSSSVRRGSVAVVSIDGPLSRNTVSSWWGEVLATGYDAIKSTLAVLMDDPHVSAVLLNIDSPGGAVSGVQELAGFVAECAKRKPMAAFTNGMMCSAAYWIGSATGRVLATETAEVGSIGVIMTLYNQQRALEKAGLGVSVISAGRLKAAGNPNTELTEEQRAYFQGHADGIHAAFRAGVADRMGLDISMAEAWGDGQVFLAGAALEKGLVSQVVAGLDEAVNLLSMESIMDRSTLEAQAPELCAELIAEGKAQAASEDLRDVFLSAARLFLSEDQAAKLDAFCAACSAAKVTKEQAEAMLSVSDLKAAAERPAEKAPAAAPAEAQAILAGIQAATPQGVPSGASAVTSKTFRDLMMQAVEKMGA